MNGKLILNNYISRLLILALASGFALKAFVCSASESKFIAILLSDDEQAYSIPANSFSDSIDAAVEIFSLEGDVGRAQTVMKAILAKNPQAIFTLGAKASYVAKVWTEDKPEIPIIFAMVLNWEKYDLFENRANMVGIAADAAPGTQFAGLTTLVPEIKRIGVIYSEEHSAQIVNRAKRSAKLLGLDLVAEKIDEPKSFTRIVNKMMDKVDSFWVIGDPVVYTLENMEWFEKRCIKKQIICIGQSENIAKVGILLSVEPDLTNIGLQASAMVKDILQQRPNPKHMGVVPPLGTRIILNMHTAKRLGLTIDKNVLDMTSNIIGQ